MRENEAPVAIFLSALSGGGAERAMVNLANQFVTMGVETHLVLGRSEGPYLELVDPRVKIFDLGVKRMLQSLRALNSYIKAERPFVLLPALAHTHIVSIVGRLLFRWSIKIVLSVQNTPSASTDVSRLRLERYWPFFVRRLYKYANKVIAISQGVADDLEELTRGKVKAEVIFNPVVTPFFFHQLEEKSSHPWLQNKIMPVILAAGRLTKQKDYPTLLSAFASLLGNRQARLIILGEGELQNEMKMLAKSLQIERFVDFSGFASNPYAFMQEADLFVLSSRWEGLANVVAEALACGTPVVSTDCPHGPAEILMNGKYGILTPTGDAGALAEAMAKALDTPPNHEQLKARGREFSVEAAASNYLNVLLKM